MRDRHDRGPSSARLLLPPALVLFLCVLASLSVHLPVYEVLGVLRDHFDAGSLALPPAAPVEVTLDYEPPPEMAAAPAPVPDEASAPSTVPNEPTPDREREISPRPEEARREREEAEPEIVLPSPVPEPEAEAEPEPEPEEEAVAEPTPPPETREDLVSVVQHVDEPEEEAPDDAHFLAEENHTAVEETVAEVTTIVTDDAEPTEIPSERESGEDAGGDDEDLVAEARDVEGSDLRRVTREEARERPAATREPPSTSRTPSAEGGATDAAGRDDTSERGTPSRSDDGGALASEGGAEIPTTELLVSDGIGSFRIRVPDRSRSAGGGGGESGGGRTSGGGAGRRGEGSGATAGDEGGGADSRGERGGVRLGLSWSDFESVYGEEELRHEREARLEERRSRRRGAGRERMWREFRAAMENYVAEVRPGNQTELGTAASPFATFLHDLHVRLHQEFAEGFITRIHYDDPNGLNDPGLHTVLEVSINPDGSLNRIGIVQSSGNILFDQGAFNAMWRAQPFPRPPGAILSGDGRAWLRWGFYRDPRWCATALAQPFILDNGPEGAGGFVDRGEDDDGSLPPDEDEGGSGFEMGPAIAPGRE